MRPTLILAGLGLLAGYAMLGWTVGFTAELGRGFTLVGWREALFWLAHALLATPGLLMIGGGVAPRLGPVLRSFLTRWLGGMRRPAPRRLSLALYAGVIVTLAVAGRSQLLLDMPLTDDENAVRFGAAIVAEGQLMAPTPQPRRAFPLLFVYERDGMITSFDFPGGIFVAALARISGLGSVLYALLALVTALAVVDAGHSLGGRRGAVTAGLLWLVSPMAVTLSLTTHSVVASRCFVALALAAWARALRAGAGVPMAFAFGVFAGAAFLCRPFEAACLLAPAAVVLVWLAPGRRTLAASCLFAGGLPAVAVFAWYNAGTTGIWYLQARFAGASGGGGGLALGDLVHRLGSNLGFNLAMLAVWLLGPLGVALVADGVARARQTRPGGHGGLFPRRRSGRAALTLAAGVVLALGLALGHGDTGIHAVGPIHYSETAVALVLLAVLGVSGMGRRLRARGLGGDARVSLAASWLVALALFTISYAPTLRAQAEILRLPVDAIAAAGARNAVVVADPQHELWDLRPELRHIRSWMIQYPHPDPFLRDDVLIVYPSVPGAQLVASFPDRAFYRMTYQAEGPPVVVERLAVAGRR